MGTFPNGGQWRSKDDYSNDVTQYVALMKEIKLRTEVIKHVLGNMGTLLYPATATESVCLQMRKILELIALGSLVANQDAWNKGVERLHSAWNAKYIFDDLRKINPDFYPTPIMQRLLDGPIKAKFDNIVENEFLTEQDFVEVYNALGAMLHAKNPLGGSAHYKCYITVIPEWLLKIRNLLNSHTIHLVHNPNMYLIQMGNEDQPPSWTEFAPLAGSSAANGIG